MLVGKINFNSREGLHNTLARLCALPGLSQSVVSYIAMRSFGEPDAFPHEDRGLLQALAIHGTCVSPQELVRIFERFNRGAPMPPCTSLRRRTELLTHGRIQRIARRSRSNGGNSWTSIVWAVMTTASAMRGIAVTVRRGIKDPVVKTYKAIKFRVRKRKALQSWLLRMLGSVRLAAPLNLATSSICSSRARDGLGSTLRPWRFERRLFAGCRRSVGQVRSRTAQSERTDGLV